MALIIWLLGVGVGVIAAAETSSVCHPVAAYLRTGNYSRCYPCPSNATLSSSAVRCVGCGLPLDAVPLGDVFRDHGVTPPQDCRCPALAVFDEVGGSPLRGVFCVPCQGWLTHGRCEPCETRRHMGPGSSGCECADGFTSVGAECISTGHLANASVLLSAADLTVPVPNLDGQTGLSRVPRDTLADDLLVVTAMCLTGSPSHCRRLAHLCALQLHLPSEAACLALQQVVPATLSELTYHQPSAAWLETEVPLELSLKPAAGKVSRLPLVLGMWTLSGEFVGLQPATDQLLLCEDLPSSAFTFSLIPGVQYSYSCYFDTRSMHSRNGTMLYEPFLDVGSHLISVPVHIARDESSLRPSSPWEYPDDLSLHRRFFLRDWDAGSGLTRFVGSMLLLVSVDEGSGTMKLPLISISYLSKSLPPSCCEARVVPSSSHSTSHFAVKVSMHAVWYGDLTETRKGIIGVGTVIAVAGAGLALLAALRYHRRRQATVFPRGVSVRSVEVPEVSGIYRRDGVDGEPAWHCRTNGLTLRSLPTGAWGVVREGHNGEQETHEMGEVAAEQRPEQPQQPLLGYQVLIASNPHGGSPPHLCFPWYTQDATLRGTVVRRTWTDVIDWRLFLEGAASGTDFVGTWLLVVLWVACGVFYIEYKHYDERNSSTVTRMLPEGLGAVFFPLLTTAFTCKAVHLAVLLWKQCHVTVHFLDWERPRDVDGTPTVIPMWRAVLLANELRKLLSKRSSLLLWTLLWVGWLLEGLGYTALATARPDVSRRSRTPWSTPPEDFGEEGRLRGHAAHCTTHPVLVVAVDGFFWLLAGIVWYIGNFLYYWFLRVHPFQAFADLCSQCNISVLLLPLPRWGFYIHGRKPGVLKGGEEQGAVRAELSLQEWQYEFQEEASHFPNVPCRGIKSAPPLCWVQCCEVFLSEARAAEIAAAYRVIGASLDTHRSSAKRSTRRYIRSQPCYEMLWGETVSGTRPLSRKGEKAAAELVDTLQRGLDDAFAGTVMRFLCAPTTLLALPPVDPLRPFRPPGAPPATTTDIQLYAEPGVARMSEWAASTSLRGAELRLYVADFALFLMVHALSGSTWGAILATGGSAFAVTRLKWFWTAHMISQGTLVDHRFLKGVI